MSSPQVILITGSSTGFGRLFAETLAHRGHTVLATMRDPKGRNGANAAALQSTKNIHVVEMDVTDDSSVDRGVDTCLQHAAGRIDVAINNAGYGLTGLVEACTSDQVREIMDTNFLGAVRVSRAVLPAMRRQHSGLLLHVSSGAGRVVFPGFGIYCASKFAMEAMAEAYHYELAGQGIESCLLEPGNYKTEIFGKIVTGSDTARTATYGAVAQIPDKLTASLDSGGGNPQQVADAVVAIVETPAGQRKIRYRVSPQDFGVDQINAVSEQVQKAVLDRFGFADATRFTQRSAATQ
ncbi:MAG TPA: SDR family oxidoreductase [Dongiaceae bacterium]|nr:SDR family oxidoreductase [Dongiaceae bacterium]